MLIASVVILMIVLCSFCLVRVVYICEQVKMTKKIVLKFKCSECSQVQQRVLKRCKHFELGAKKAA